jgi:cellulose synthase/poly-beta-1,6-N-acetylglucosamine synthase-like glycosyltransferase
MPEIQSLGLVVIGRNEGLRLAQCLASVRDIKNRVYVDSGSSDGSIALAQREGVTVVELAVPPHFTAARARNAGLKQLLLENPDLEFVQMVDGDCEVRPDWILTALAALAAEPDLALVFGRRRERFPDVSVYNALCDDEWNVPVGEASGCGGDALFRVAALQQVDFYNSTMIAAEDTEMCMRLRKRGWKLRRIDAEMTLHDAAITRLRQWWNRTRRSGHGFGELAYLHPDSKYPNWRRTVRSIVAWGGLMPSAFLVALLFALRAGLASWLAPLLLLAPWPLRMIQLARRQRQRGLSWKVACASGILLMLGKVPQFFGLIGYHLDRATGHASRLIEYKGPKTA